MAIGSRIGPARGARPSEPQAALGPAHLQDILEAVADGVTAQTPDGRLVYANGAAAQMLGSPSAAALLAADPAEILGRFELVDAAGEQLDRDDLPARRLLRGEATSAMLVGLRAVGARELRWVQVRAVPLRDRAGRLEFVVTGFRDVTDRKRLAEERDGERARLAETLTERLADEARLAELIRSERARSVELNAIIGAIGEGIVVVEADGAITLANRTARRMLGPLELGDLDQLLGRFEHPGRLRAELASGPVTGRLEGGPPGWIEIAAYPVDAPAGGRTTGTGPHGTILVLRDVTAARERDRARDAFIGMLSHELRTPITTIYAGAKLLSRAGRIEDATRAEIFEDIHGEAERLHWLVEDVVALTRFGEGAMEIGNEPVLLQRILPAVVRSEEDRWPGGRVELRLEPDLPPISGDATYVEQVVRNLLANALKYGGAAPSPRLVASAAGEDVEVRVLDDGPGFPEGDADRLFELYYRSPEVTRKVSGSGIGLFVCARLIEAMGGRIWARNRPAGGSEFGFALRVMPEAE